MNDLLLNVVPLIMSTESHGVTEEYVDLLTDPAHLAYEVTLIVLIDVLLLGFAWPFIKKAVARHDKKHH